MTAAHDHKALPLQLALKREFANYTGKRVGILGGSFNPAHAGHIHICQQAKRRLQLDAVIWLVSPANPLKDVNTLHDYTIRLTHAKKLTQHISWLHVSDIEQRYQCYTTIESMALLTPALAGAYPVWLMGADSLQSFHRWQAWQNIAHIMPIAVLDRPNTRSQAMHSPAARSLRSFLLPETKAQQLPTSAPPCWCYLSVVQHALSATHLRKTLGKSAFLGHNSQ